MRRLVFLQKTQACPVLGQKRCLQCPHRSTRAHVSSSPSSMCRNLWSSDQGSILKNNLCFSLMQKALFKKKKKENLCWIMEIFHVSVVLTLTVKCGDTTASGTLRWAGLLLFLLCTATSTCSFRSQRRISALPLSFNFSFSSLLQYSSETVMELRRSAHWVSKMWHFALHFARFSSCCSVSRICIIRKRKISLLSRLKFLWLN